ncbi:tape measure protein [Leifsonia aquatica]|uniref:tape measure protein n=1 Tax=Leifsonia aquatica TaxID=144185 RepID=UPI0004694F15|nr:tape measure protein [Leifsonia aquatica]
MAFDAGTLVATIRLDGKGKFDSDLDSSGRKFTLTESMAKKAGAAIAGALKGAAVTTGALTVATTAYVASLFRTGVAYNQLQQSSRAALSTLLGGATAANAQMDKLDAFAKQSPFAKSVFITAQQQLLGFGLQAEKVIPALTAIQDAVAAVGGSNDQVSQITYALAQMRGQGKLTGETLNQLGQFGIDAATLVGAKMGKTGAEIRDMASKPGGIPVDEVWDPLVSALEDKFGGAAANVKNTYTGTLDRIKAASRDIGAALAEPFVGKNSGGLFVTWGNQVADVLRAVEKKVAPTVAILEGRAAPAFERITDFLTKAKDVVVRFDPTKIDSFLDRIGKNAPAVAAVAGATAAMNVEYLRSIPVLGQLLPKINPIAAAVAGIALSTPQSRQALSDLMRAVQPLVPVVGELAMTLSKDLVQILPPVASGISGIAKAATPLLQLLGDMPPSLLLAVAGYIGFTKVQAPLAEGILNAGVRLEGFLGKLGPIGGKLGGVVDGLAGMAGTLSGPWGLAIGGAAALIGGVWLDNIAKAQAKIDEYTDSLDKNTGAITENTKSIAVDELTKSGAYQAAKTLGIGYDTVTQAALGNANALDTIARAQAEATRQYQQGATASDNSSGKYLAAANKLMAAVGSESDAIKNSVESDRDKAKALGLLETAQGDLTDAVSKASDAITANGATLDTSTAAGQANKDALDNLAAASNNLVDATAKQTGSVYLATQAYNESKARLYDVAAQMGLTGAAADEYVTKHLANIPAIVQTKVEISNDAALRAIDEVNRVYSNLQARMNAGQNVIVRPGGPMVANERGNLYQHGAVQAFANGGFGSGMYPGGRPIYKFAEEGVPWEVFISGKTSEKERNQRILARTAGLLDMVAVPAGSARSTAFATGGTVTYQAPALAAASASRDLRPVTIVMNVYPSEGMNERDVADLAARGLERRLRG